MAETTAAMPTRTTTRWDGRPVLVAVAAINAVLGGAALAVLAPLTFGGDVDIFRRGAEGVQHGVIAQDFFYAPLFGVLALPLTWVPFGVAALAMSLLGLAIVLAGVVIETRGLQPIDRALVGIAVVGFIPVVYELVVGQVTMLMAAAIYPVRDRDGWKRGIALGVVAALIPKPMLIPLFAWMLLRRRRALASALVTGAIVTLAGVALLGPAIHGEWVRAVTETGQITRQGNVALTVIAPRELGWLLIALGVVAIAWAILRDERRGFVAAIVGALLVQPFTLTYAISIVVLAVRPALGFAPRATRVLALTANLGVLGAFIPWCAAALAASLPRARRTGTSAPAEP
jgi:Glycosyltransferase family 87